MVTKRRSHESGHQRKFLAVVDDTPECDRAVLYAAKRAANTNGALTLIYVCPPGDFQHWIGVEEIMRAEALEEANLNLDKFAQFSRERANLDPELVVREGKTADAITELIEEDEDIAILVLAASDSNEGPGPLVSSIAGRGNAFPIPVIIVPCAMSDEEIEAVT